jgi:hypothetical protein
MPRGEFAARPLDVAASIRPHPHLGPFLGEHEELFRADPGQRRGPEILGQVTHGARGRPARVNPSPKRHDQRRQVVRRLAVELYKVHEHPFGSGERLVVGYGVGAHAAAGARIYRS